MIWQTARPTRGQLSGIKWKDGTAGYPEKLLANDKILVSNGTYTNVYGIDRKAYAVMDCAAYLAGRTDYTPIAMYTGD